MYPIFVIDNQIKRFLEMQYTTINNENTVNNATKIQTQPKLSLIKFVISIVKTITFSPLKIGSFFSCKNYIPKFLQSYVVY